MNFTIEEVLDKLDTLPIIQQNPIACKARVGMRQIFIREFLYAAIHLKTNAKAAEFLGIGYQTVNRTLKRVFLDPHLNGGGETWDKYILYLVNIKRCNVCNTYQDISSFDNENCSKQKLSSICKLCKKDENAINYNNNKDYWESYLVLNRPDYVYRNALRRSSIMERTPSWANLGIIKAIYNNAEGCHVDHIIPLQGEFVSGLHVETNMQYLTAEENLFKSNKFNSQNFEEIIYDNDNDCNSN